jgi:hypothetical protein
MLANTVAKMEVVVKHGTECEGNRLYFGQQCLVFNEGRDNTLRYMYEVGGRVVELGVVGSTGWVSRSSKRMPPENISIEHI